MAARDPVLRENAEGPPVPHVLSNIVVMGDASGTAGLSYIFIVWQD